MTMNRLKKATITGFALASLASVVLFPGPSRAAASPVDDGQTTFRAKCAVCHGADGGGNTPMGKKSNMRDLRSAEVQKQSDAQLSGIISKGKDKMPTFGKSLSPEQIKEVVAFIRTLKK